MCSSLQSKDDPMKSSVVFKIIQASVKRKSRRFGKVEKFSFQPVTKDIFVKVTKLKNSKPCYGRLTAYINDADPFKLNVFDNFVTLRPLTQFEPKISPIKSKKVLKFALLGNCFSDLFNCG